MIAKRRVPQIRFKGFSGEWEEQALEKIAEIIGGGTPSTSIPEYWDGDIDWYSPTEIGSDIYKQRSVKKITKLGLEKSSAKILPSNKTVLFTSRAGIGSIAILKKDGATNQGFQSFVVKDDNYTYFIYSLGYKIKQHALRIASGSTFLEISGKQLAKIRINIPEKNEQTKIGNYFQNLDKLIEQKEKKEQKLKQFKKAMLDKMFPKNGANTPEIRFKGFGGEWEEKEISELFTVTRGDVLAATETSSKKSEEMPYPVYSSQTKNDGLLGFYKKYLFENAITWTTDGANAGTVKHRDGKFYSTNVNGVLLSTEGYANQAIAETLNCIAWKHVSYVGNPKLMNNVMSKIKIAIPSSIKEQNYISDILIKQDKLIDLHHQELEKLKNIKKASLSKMFV